MTITLALQLEQLQAILQAIPFFIKSSKCSLPILGLNDSDENTLDGISGLRNFQDSVSKEIEVLKQVSTCSPTIDAVFQRQRK